MERDLIDRAWRDPPREKIKRPTLRAVKPVITLPAAGRIYRLSAKTIGIRRAPKQKPEEM